MLGHRATIASVVALYLLVQAVALYAVAGMWLTGQ